MSDDLGPLPEHTKAPSRSQELLIAVLSFLLVVLRISIKLVIVCVMFFAAFIAAITWKK